MPGPKDFKSSFKAAAASAGVTNTAENNKNLTSSSLKPDTLLTTEKIIELAKLRGVDFGPGDPNERIRYFIKLDILPHQVRKSPDPERQIAPIGHLPYSTVQTLMVTDRLKQR